jgi:hypothetical protein
MIAASAIAAGCDTPGSEPMHHGMTPEEKRPIANAFPAAI